MAPYQSQSISQDKFLLICTNLLHRAFIEAARTDAKKVYRVLVEGQRIYLTTVEMENKSTVRFNISLDKSEFRGKLNYSAFRASLATLIGHISQVVQDEREVNVFNPQDNSGTMIFGITAVTLEDDQPNVMVLGADTADQGNEVMLRLMYLDPSQFTADPVATTPV